MPTNKRHPNMPKKTIRVSVDKVPSTGQYRVQIVATLHYADGSKASDLVGKRTFNLRKDAEKWAKDIRKNYKK